MATFTENEYKGVSLKMKDVFVIINKDIETPSRVDGLDEFSEMALRIIGCESIQDAGKMLKLPQVAIACAQVLYHRFYFSKSFVRHNWEHYAMSCVFLSAKIEECCRRLRDVVNVFVHIRQLREQKLLKSLTIPEYAELKPYIIKAERRVLKELGFCVHGKHSHKLICIYLHILGQDQNKDLVQLSWNYMNDSLRTTVFCHYQPEIIACACIYLAAIHLQFPLGQNWFEIFGAHEEMVKSICLSILELYSVKNINIVNLELKLTKLKKEQMEARNQKIAQDKKDEIVSMKHNSGDSKGRKSDDDNNKRDVDNRGKENMEKNRDRHKKSSRKRRSTSPIRERRYRSRSPKTRERSSDRKKNIKKHPTKEHSDKRYRKSYESEEQQQQQQHATERQQQQQHQPSSRKIKSNHVGTTSKDYHKRRSISPNSSASDKQQKQQYRKRKRSSSVSNNNNNNNNNNHVQHNNKPPVSSKHSSRKMMSHNGGSKMYR